MNTVDMYTRCLYYREVMADSGAPEVVMLKDKWIHSARVQHQCDDCGNPIEVGQPYVYNVFLVDGDLFHQKRHTSYCCD